MSSSNWIKEICPNQSLTDPFLSFHFKVNHFLVFSIVILTFVSSYFAIKLLYKHNIFSNCTRTIFIFSIFNANVQQLNIFIIRIHGLYKSIAFSDDRCKLFYKSSDCFILETINYFTYVAAMACLVSLTIDRIFAFILYDFYMRYQKWISGVLCCLAYLLALLIHSFVFWDDPWNDVMPMCYYPTYHSVTRFTTVNFYMAFFVVGNIFVNLLVLWKSYIGRGKNRVYDTALRYKTHENVLTLRAICYISIAQFLFFSLSPISAFVMSVFATEVSPALFHGSFIWTSGITYSQLCLPVIIWYTIKRVKFERASEIRTMTTAFQSTDSHIEELKRMWR